MLNHNAAWKLVAISTLHTAFMNSVHEQPTMELVHESETMGIPTGECWAEPFIDTVQEGGHIYQALPSNSFALYATSVHFVLPWRP